jgi:hypothetical protein
VAVAVAVVIGAVAMFVAGSVGKVDIQTGVTPVGATAEQAQADAAAGPPPAPLDIDPTLYDDFNDPAFDGSFNRGQWSSFGESNVGQIIQEDGSLTMSRGGKSESGVGLVALEYRRKPIQTPTFYEARFMVDKPQDGHVYSFLGSNLPSEDYTDCTLGYGDERAKIECGYFHNEETMFWTEARFVDFGTWHTVRIEIDPEPMAFTYYIDGQDAGAYVPPNTEELKQEAEFQFDIGVWGASTEEVTAYIDEVRVGPFQR